MIRSILVAGVSAAALALSVPAFAQDEAEASDAPEMTFGSWGIDPASLDTSVEPGDDFFAYRQRQVGARQSRSRLPTPAMARSIFSTRNRKAT